MTRCTTVMRQGCYIRCCRRCMTRRRTVAVGSNDVGCTRILMVGYLMTSGKVRIIRGMTGYTFSTVAAV